jgi:hypothetical protein
MTPKRGHFDAGDEHEPELTRDLGGFLETTDRVVIG